jgi:tyrosyl-tRNA synthetase
VTPTAQSSVPTDLTTSLAPDLVEELRWRGMLHQHTPGLPERLARGPIALYNGFDPTADSLHVGHLVPVFGLLHFQRHGNRPIVVVGGGTGMIGDPSFRSADRVLLRREDVEHNVAGIRAQLASFLDFASGPTAAQLIDNYDWLSKFGLIEFLRDIGRYFTIPYMLGKDSVQTRLEAGLSFTEFSYMLLQSADYLHLYREAGVELQTGGADQWGNITAGLELIRRVEGGDEGADRAHALSFPLFMNASGNKFGKSQADGNVWLDPARTTPFEFYQYWFDSADQDIGKLLRTFTLFDRASVERLEAEGTAHPEARAGQRALAYDITARVHGAAAAEAAVTESGARFGPGAVDSAIVDFEADPGALDRRGDIALGGAATHRAGRFHGQRRADHRSGGRRRRGRERPVAGAHREEAGALRAGPWLRSGPFSAMSSRRRWASRWSTSTWSWTGAS